MTGREAGNLLKLITQIRNTRIIELRGYFAQRQRVVHQQLLYFFKFLRYKVLLDGGTFDLRKQIGEIIIIQVQRLAQKFGQIGFQLCTLMMYLMDDDIFNFSFNFSLLILYHSF